MRRSRTEGGIHRATFDRSVRMDSRQVGEGIADAVIAADLRGIVLSWNSQAEFLFGYSAAEAIGCSLNELLLPSERDLEPRSDDVLCLRSAETPQGRRPALR